ncbi:hypothetical protein [Foetidibacter luteolus]|uniref:hypothetical protein n=1 Tax=Foetidibacter luteolus TaxID=2608880 RepID=UPI00129B52CF|nr:hypothetical protein [Foetidibacter luteolus]
MNVPMSSGSVKAHCKINPLLDLIIQTGLEKQTIYQSYQLDKLKRNNPSKVMYFLHQKRVFPAWDANKNELEFE